MHKRFPPYNPAIGGHLGNFAALCKREGSRFQRRQIVGDPGQDDFFQGHAGLGLREAAVEGVERQNDAGARGVQVILKLWRSREWMHHRGHRA